MTINQHNFEVAVDDLMTVCNNIMLRGRITPENLKMLISSMDEVEKRKEAKRFDSSLS